MRAGSGRRSGVARRARIGIQRPPHSIIAPELKRLGSSIAEIAYIRLRLNGSWQLALGLIAKWRSIAGITNEFNGKPNSEMDCIGAGRRRSKRRVRSKLNGLQGARESEPASRNGQRSARGRPRINCANARSPSKKKYRSIFALKEH